MRGRLMNCQSLRQQSTAIHCKAPQLKPLRAGYGVGAAITKTHYFLLSVAFSIHIAGGSGGPALP
jgi:hypothetical protein